MSMVEQFFSVDYASRSDLFENLGDLLNADEKKMFQKVSVDMENYLAANSIRALSDYLGRYYGKRPIILLDEYDTPM